MQSFALHMFYIYYVLHAPTHVCHGEIKGEFTLRWKFITHPHLEANFRHIYRNDLVNQNYDSNEQDPKSDHIYDKLW